MRNRRRTNLLSGLALRWFIILLAPIVLGLLCITKNFPGLQDRQALDMAQVARNLARTGHYVTQSIRPLSLVFKASIENHPDLYNEPLQPFLLSWVFRVWNAADKPVAALGMLLWLATFWLTLAFAKRLFGWRIAALAVVLFAANVAVLGNSVSGTSAMLATLLMLLLLWTLYRRDVAPAEGEKPASAGLPSWRLALAGALVGLSTLTMYALSAAIVPVVAYALADQRRGRWRRAGIVLGGMAIVLLPWLIRNQAVVGDPFFSLHIYDVAGGTATYPGDSLFRSIDPETARQALPLTFTWHHLRDVAAKVRVTIGGLPGIAVGTLGALVGVFFFFSLFQQFGDRGLVRLRRCFYGVFVLHTVALALTRSNVADLLIYVPFGTILAAVGMARLIGAIDLASLRQAWQGREWRIGSVAFGRLAILVVLVGISTWPFGRWLRMGSNASAVASLPKLEWMKPAAGDVPLVMSDIPQGIAWYCDRPAVWLTDSSRGYDRLAAKVKPIGVLHFWQPPLDLARAERADWWTLAYTSPAPYKGLVQNGPGGPSPYESLRTSSSRPRPASGGRGTPA